MSPLRMVDTPLTNSELLPSLPRPQRLRTPARRAQQRPLHHRAPARSARVRRHAMRRHLERDEKRMRERELRGVQVRAADEQERLLVPRYGGWRV